MRTATPEQLVKHYKRGYRIASNGAKPNSGFKAGVPSDMAYQVGYSDAKDGKEDNSEQFVPKTTTTQRVEVNIDHIDRGRRFRKDLGDIEELMASIEETDLIHPITVLDKSKLSEPHNDETQTSRPYLLLAGGRRLAAFLRMKKTHIPVTIISENKTTRQIRLIELHENVKRKQMTFDEVSDSYDEIHSLLVAERGEKISAHDDGHTMKDTAKEMGVSVATVSRNIAMAAALREHPELKEAETRREAEKLYAAKIKKLAAAELQRRIDSRKNLTNKQQKQSILTQRYILGDFFDGVKKIEDKTVDFVELDPPYGIDLGKLLVSGASSGGETTERRSTGRDYDDIDPDDYPDFMQKTIEESYRVMKDHSWIIVWFAETWRTEVKFWLEEQSFFVRHVPALWIKGNGRSRNPKFNLPTAYESFFYARKGTPSIAKPRATDYYNYPAASRVVGQHPCRRPIEMYEDVLATFARPGSIVLSPFVGSGNVILAADNLGIKAIGFDQQKSYRDFFVANVHGHKEGKYRSYK